MIDSFTSHAFATLKIILCNDQRWPDSKLADTVENVLGVIRVREFGNQLPVNRQVRSQHKEVLNLLDSVKVGNEGPHQSSLPDACCQSEAQRREFPLEAFHCWKLRSDYFKLLIEIGGLVEVDDLANTSENLK